MHHLRSEVFLFTFTDKRIRLISEHLTRDSMAKPWQERKDEIKERMLAVAKEKGPLRVQEFHDAVRRTFLKEVDDIFDKEKNPPEMLMRRCLMSLLMDDYKLQLLNDCRIALMPG